MDKLNTIQQFESYLNARCQPGTAKVYVNALKLWLSYLNGNEPSQKSAQSYINSLIKKKLSPSTVNLRGSAIRRWFKYQGIKIELDYPTAIRLKEPQYLSIEEVEQVIAACRTPLERALVIILFDTAVRVSELMNLRIKDIDWNKGLLSVTRKGGGGDLVNISDRGAKALRDWIDSRQLDTERVFGSVEYYDVWRLLRVIGKRAGLKNVRPHIFRHSRAIQMLSNGATIYAVQQHLGHKNISTTMNVYGRFKAADLKEQIPSW